MRLRAIAMLLLLAPIDCPDQGSRAVPAQLETGPPLACALAPHAPAWHLWTPPHRVPVPATGERPGDARMRSRLLLRYRCTGFRLLPILPAELRTLGYVLDVPALACR